MTPYELYQYYLQQYRTPNVSSVSPLTTLLPQQQSGGNDPVEFTPVQSSIQQQLTPRTMIDELMDQYINTSWIGFVKNALQDYVGLTDAQKDAYSEYGLGYGNTGLKDQFGYNVFSLADNWAAPGSGSYNAHKASGKTDQQIAEMRDRVMSAPTKADMRAQQTQYEIDQAQRQQDYLGLTNLGVMGLGVNPAAYGAHSLAALGPAYDDPNEFSSGFSGPFGGYNGFDGTEGTFSTDTSNTGATQSNQNSVDTAAQDADQSGGEASSTSGADPAGDGGDGYATGGRVGFADGSLYLPYTNFLNLLKGRTSGTFNEEGQYVPFNYQMYVRPEQGIFDIYNRPMYSGQPNAEQLYQQYLGQTPNEDFLNYINSFKENIPTEDFSGYLNQSTDAGITALPQTQETNKTLAETLFPQGDFLNIRETATSPTQYNIEATKDLVENLPGGIVKDIVAPAVAGVMSLPYDAIQAYQRMQPGSGLSGFAKAYAAERPLQSAFERFVGASGPLAENINKAVSNLNPFQKQQYMQYATQNPEQAREAAQRNQDFIQAVQRGNQATGGRVNYLQGGLTSLLGNYYGKR